MDHDDTTIGTIFTRRQALSIASRAGMAFIGGSSLAGVLSRYSEHLVKPQVHLVASPSLTEGPFYVNEKLKRSDLRGDSKRETIVKAKPLMLNLTLYSGATSAHFKPLVGAQVDVWHVDASGAYSDEPQGLNPEDTQGQNWLRGYQVTDHAGKVSFKTIFPGWYESRTTHIHFKVHYLGDGSKPATFTSQLFFPDEFADAVYEKTPYQTRSADQMRNSWDQVYNERLSDGSPAGKLMTLHPLASHGPAGLVADYSVALITHPHPSMVGAAKT